MDKRQPDVGASVMMRQLVAVALMCSVTLAPTVGVAAKRNDREAIRQALAVFKQGKTAFKAKDYDAALKFFRQAQAIYEHEPLIIYALAKTLEKAKQTEMALNYYQLFLTVSDAQDKERPIALQRIRAIKEQLASRPSKIILKGLPAGAKVFVDGRETQPDPLNAVVTGPGKHSVKVTLGNRLPFIKSGVALVAGQALTLDVLLLEPIDPSLLPRDHTWTWVAGGATALATLAVGILALRRVALLDEYYELVERSGKVNNATLKQYECQSTKPEDCPELWAEVTGRKQAYDTNDTWMYGTGIAAGVLAVATVAAFFAAPVKNRDRAAISLTPTFDGRQVGLSIRF